MLPPSPFHRTVKDSHGRGWGRRKSERCKTPGERLKHLRSLEGNFGHPGHINPGIGISPTIYRAQNPETPKSLKKVSREEFGTPDPQKVPKKKGSQTPC